MTPGERLKKWLEDTGVSFADRLSRWAGDTLKKGGTSLIDSIEPETIDLMSKTLLKMKDNPSTPADIKEMIEKAMTPGKPIPALLLIPLAVIMFIPMITSIVQPLGRLLEYQEDKLLSSARFDPISAITAWRRDPEKYAELFTDLKDLGWSDKRIETLKFLTEVIPGVQDLVRMAVREAFTPEIAEKFGQYQDFPTAITEWGQKQGLSEEWMKRYWASHWDLPSPMQGFEMLHRGVIDKPTLEMLLRALDVMPYWRDKLTAISWNVPTRVDIRRFYKLGVIDDDRLRELYTAFGYHDVDLDNIVEFTKMDAKSAETAEGKELTKTEIYKGVKQGKINRAEGAELLVDLGYSASTAALLLAINIPQDETDAVEKQRELTKTDIIAGLKAEIITEEEARDKLIELRYTSDAADFLLKIFKVNINPPEEAKEREASKADIVKAVKTGLITPESGYLMLQDIGFTPEASQFILMVQAETTAFSPVDFTEFKDLTQQYRIASGLEAVSMTEELKKAAEEVKRLTTEVESLQRAVKEEGGGLVKEEVLPAETTARLNRLQVKLHRAEAELARARLEYDKQVAEWRHSR